MVTTPLALHDMEDGCIASPERGVSIKYTKMMVTKQVHLCTINTYMYDRHTSHAEDILALMTSLGLYVMKEGCLATLEASVSEQ